MFNYKEPPIVLSVGGSLLSTKDGINTEFLTQLNEFIRKYVKRGKRFFLVAGGGVTAREYRDAGKTVIGTMSDADLDWIGIHATRLNAHLIRTIFEDIAHPRIIENYDKKLINWREPIVIGAGWKPGWSTDYCAVMLAKDYGANVIVNMSNIDWVYDKDPRFDKNAKPIEKITWEELEKIVGTEWSPGINAPFDPIATQLGRKLGLTVIVANGENFKNMENIIEGDTFKGTVVLPYKIDASFYDREYYMGNKARYRLAPKSSVLGKIFIYLASYYRALIIFLFLKPKKCLDVGCGTGIMVKILRRLGVDAYGVEISDDALKLADKSIVPFLQKADILKLPFDKDEFDLVVTFDVLEHVDRIKINKAINETIRVSKKLILHKVYTRENLWMTWFSNKDYSRTSVFSAKFWQKKFLEHKDVSLQRNSIFRLPSFMESIFLLKKK
jgi:uridylate kinase